MTVLITAGAYVLSRVVPVEQWSSATVVAGPKQRAGFAPVTADAGTESEIARSGAVLRVAAEELKMAQSDLADGLDVEPVERGAAITVAYTGDDAQRRAQAVAEEYVRYRNATTTQSGTAATLVSPAGAAVEHRRPLWLWLAAGAAVGLLLGLISAYWLARRRDRLRGLTHYEQLTGLPVLATVPRARRSRGPGAPLPVMLRSPDSADAEAYRYLRARLDPVLARPATVLIAGGREGEGRSTTAANLAVALAQAGRRVVLVDTDVRRPALHLMFDLSRDRGLTNVLTGQHQLTETLAAGAIVNLRVLAVGAERENSADLLAAGGLTGLLHELREQCDVVVLDSPALLQVADGLGLAAHADQILLVTDYRRATAAGAARVAADLEQVAPGRVAAVLIGLPEREGGPAPRNSPSRSPAIDRFESLDNPVDPAPSHVPAPSHAPHAPAPPHAPVSPARPAAPPHANHAPSPSHPPHASAPSHAPVSPAQPTAPPHAPHAPAPSHAPVSPARPTAPPRQEPTPPRKEPRHDPAPFREATPGEEPREEQSPRKDTPTQPSRPAPKSGTPEKEGAKVSAKAAIPQPRVYTSAAKAEAEARGRTEAPSED
ncbi:AAA family ATPase [Actinoplanes sp. TRM 88003]|uniref:AAA family ATPase n=1 Tax=Paractinoplanes aksuensis TaxID=2939490 RepID=A0ABT1DGA9_9ACTN|nr:polysaccharide biosynthesis tyrosine autokinase [Actinoplanes aksuensis]MCO8269835.1 AAA family ATPase [Actinoplanes aksuensis]